MSNKKNNWKNQSRNQSSLTYPRFYKISSRIKKQHKIKNFQLKSQIEVIWHHKIQKLRCNQQWLEWAQVTWSFMRICTKSTLTRQKLERRRNRLKMKSPSAKNMITLEQMKSQLWRQTDFQISIVKQNRWWSIQEIAQRVSKSCPRAAKRVAIVSRLILKSHKISFIIRVSRTELMWNKTQHFALKWAISETSMMLVQLAEPSAPIQSQAKVKMLYQ